MLVPPLITYAVMLVPTLITHAPAPSSPATGPLQAPCDVPGRATAAGDPGGRGAAAPGCAAAQGVGLLPGLRRVLTSRPTPWAWLD